MSAATQKKGLLENAFTSHRWDSKIKSANTTRSERWLGYTAEKVAWMASFMVLPAAFTGTAGLPGGRIGGLRHL